MGLLSIKKEVHGCARCGAAYGNNACGFGKTHRPLIFFIATNPPVKNHEFDKGRGIKIMEEEFAKYDFDDFYFDNVVKCQMPTKVTPDVRHAHNCLPFLRSQIRAVKPEWVVVFGRYAARALHLQSKEFWTEAGWYLGIPVWLVPHFSWPLHRGGRKEMKAYHRKLRRVIECLSQRSA